jgi:hypothetical protein
MVNELDKISSEARARIIWGDTIPEVKDWLRSKGLSVVQIECVITSSIQERSAAIRLKGIRNAIVGSILIVVSTLLFIWLFNTKHHYISNYRGSYIVALLYVFGAWRLGMGLYYIISGSKASGSLTDM